MSDRPEVAGSGPDRERRIRNPRRELLAVAERDHRVRVAVEHGDRTVHGLDVEAPRAGDRGVVGDNPARAVEEGLNSAITSRGGPSVATTSRSFAFSCFSKLFIAIRGLMRAPYPLVPRRKRAIAGCVVDSSSI